MNIVVFTGAGISAESGIKTFRDSGGLWEEHRIEDVATPEGWARNPPFANDHAFARAILDYRADLLTRYGEVANTQGTRQDSRAWFAAHRAELEQIGRTTSAPGALMPTLLTTLEADKDCVADIGALNRWAERTALALPAYLDAWSTSCRQLGSTGRLPNTLRGMLLA